MIQLAQRFATVRVIKRTSKIAHHEKLYGIKRIQNINKHIKEKVEAKISM